MGYLGKTITTNTLPFHAVPTTVPPPSQAVPSPFQAVPTAVSPPSQAVPYPSRLSHRLSHLPSQAVPSAVPPPLPGCPITLTGCPNDCTTSLLGCPITLPGCPTSLPGCPITLPGCPNGCSTSLAGCPNGCPISRPRLRLSLQLYHLPPRLSHHPLIDIQIQFFYIKNCHCLNMLKLRIYITNLLSFVNKCRATWARSAPVFHDYFSVHESEYDVRNVGRLNIPRART